MGNLSPGQLRALSDFFNTIAAAWFTGGVITPLFAKVSQIERFVLFVLGLGLSYIFLHLSLSTAKEVG